MKEAPTCGEQAGAEGDGDLLNTATLPDPAQPAELNPLLTAARGYLGRGLVPIRLGNRAKKPLGKVEENIVTADNAAALLTYANLNLGLRLGADGGGLVDYDLDWPEARQLADLLLFNLPKFGRATARGSHRLVRCKAGKFKKFDIPELKGMAGLPEEHAICVLEVRASPNSHTMVPPSVHPNGEAVEWERDTPIPEDSVEGINQKAGLLAFLSVCARYYPGQGSRDDFCMALAGALLAAGLPVEDANRCIIRVAEVARDEEAPKRGKAGQTAAKVDEGEPVTGIPRVVEMLGLPEAVAGRFRKWLGVSDAAQRDDGRVQVHIDYNRRHLMLDAVAEAVAAAGLPIYQSAGAVVTPVRPKGGALRLVEVDAIMMQEFMTEAVNFVKVGGEGQHVPAYPEEHFAKGYIARAKTHKSRLPDLRGTVGHPTIRRDGSLLWAEGFDPETGLIVDYGGVAFPPVPDEPTEGDARAALEVLKVPLKDFPFVEGSASRSVALSAILTAVCRRSLDFAPVHAFNAPSPETGKSLLSDIPAMVVTGVPAPKHAQERDPEENDKSLLGALMQGDPVIVIDNVDRPIEGATWCLILTSQEWEKRGLGGNAQRKVLTNVLFIFNGNNIEFRGDMATRAVMATIDAGVEEPGSRPFDVDLREDVPRRRGELVSAVLTVLRAHAVAGFPGWRREGRFGDWTKMVRGALIWLGEPDPWATQVGIRG